LNLGADMKLKLEEASDNLVEGEIHFFKLQAINDVGISEFSD
jgi:hypothetical protein